MDGPALCSDPVASHSEPRDRLVAGAAVALLSARVLLLARTSSWWVNPDEGIYFDIATVPIGQAMAQILANAHPPLYYLLLRAMASVSLELGWLRLPSLVSAVALPAVVYALTCRIAGRTAGVAAAAFVAFSPALLALAQVMRPYALWLLCLALALLALAKALQPPEPRRGALLAFSAAMSAAMALHYGTALALVAIGIALFAGWAGGRVDARRLRAVVLATLPVAVLALGLFVVHVGPHVLGEGLRERATGDFYRALYPRSAPALAFATLSAFRYVFGAGWLAALALLAAGALRSARVPALRMPAALAAAALLVSVVFAATGAYPLGATRHASGLLVLVAPALGASAAHLLSGGRRTASALMLAMLLGTGAVTGDSAGALREQLVPRTQADDVRAWLGAEGGADAVWISDMQTRQLLRPFFGAEGYVHFPGEGLLVVHAGRSPGGRARNLVLPPDPRVWALAWRREAPRTSHHLASLLARLEANPVWRERVERGGVWLVQGGWGANMAAAPEARAPDGRPLFTGMAGGPELAALKLDLDAYRAYLGGR